MKNKEFNIMKKRFLAALLCLCLLVGLVPGMGTTAFAAGSYNIGDIVTFAGYDWYIIGTESEGVTAPSGCYTLFAKNNDFGSTAFRAGAGSGALRRPARAGTAPGSRKAPLWQTSGSPALARRWTP